MKITIVYRYFWPDTPPYAVMLREMTAWLAQAGHDVEVVTAQPSYKREAGIPKQPSRESVNGVTVRRLPLFRERGPGFMRLINSALFIALASWDIAFGRRRDLVWTATMPPVVQAAVLRRVSHLRGAMFLYQMQDIYPELGVVSRTMKDGLIARLLRRIDMITLRKSDAVVVLSDDMEKAIEERGAPPRRLRIINNFALTNDEERRLPSLVRRKPLKFVFAGNIGRFQNLETLVDAFGRISPDLAQLELAGEGRVKSTLIEFVKKQQISNVTFRDHMPVEQIGNYLSAADVGIVSLSPGIYRYAFPSKTLTYLSVGLPIMALAEDGSALQRMIEDNKLGVNVPWHTGLDGIAAGVRQIARAIEAGSLSGEVPRFLYHAAEARRKWLELIRELERAKDTER